MLWTGRQISAEKSSCIIGLLSHCVHMSVPRKIVVDQDSQVLCILGVSEFFAMDGVVGINRLPLLGYLDYYYYIIIIPNLYSTFIICAYVQKCFTQNTLKHTQIH